MSRLRLLVLSFSVILMLTGCAAIVKNPQITIQKAGITGVDSSGVELEFLLGVTNPNSFDISLLGYSYDLQLMALPFSSGSNQGEVNFPSGSLTEFRLPLRIKFVDALELLKRNPEADRIPYRMSASLNLRTPLGEMLIPVDKSDAFQLPEMYRAGSIFRRLLSVPDNNR